MSVDSLKQHVSRFACKKAAYNLIFQKEILEKVFFRTRWTEIQEFNWEVWRRDR